MFKKNGCSLGNVCQYMRQLPKIEEICSLACWKINLFLLRNTDGVCVLRDSMLYCLSCTFVLVVWSWEVNCSVIPTLFFSFTVKNLYVSNLLLKDTVLDTEVYMSGLNFAFRFENEGLGLQPLINNHELILCA